MKKIIAISLLLFGVVFLAGCGQRPVNQAQPTTTAPVEKKTVTFNERTVSKKFKNKSGVPIDFDMTFPQLAGNYDGITAINSYYDKEEEKFIAQKDSGYLSSDSPSGDNFFFKANLKVESVLGNIISMSGDGDSSAGGVGNLTIYGDIFNLDTGEKMTLDDVFNVGSKEYLKLIYGKVSDSINKEIKGMVRSRYDMFDDAYSADGQKAVKSFDPNDFYLTDAALVVNYPKYILASGSAGTFQFMIPYDSIKDVLKSGIMTDKALKNEITGWETYQNVDMVFEIKFPQHLEYMEIVANNPPGMSIPVYFQDKDAKPGSKFPTIDVGYFWNDDKLSLDEWIRQHSTQDDYSPEKKNDTNTFFYKFDSSKAESVTIGTLNGFRFRCSSGYGDYEDFALFSRDDKIFFVRQIATGGNLDADFEKMYPTLNFMN